METYKQTTNRVINLLKNSIGIDEKSASTIVKCSGDFAHEQTPFCEMNDQEIVNLVKTYLDLFGSIDNLCRFLEAQITTRDDDWETTYRIKTIFHFKPHIIESRFYNLENQLNLTKDACVELITAVPAIIYREVDYTNSRIKELLDFWGIDKKELVKACVQIPYFWGKHLNRLHERITVLADHFGVQTTFLKQFFLKHPNYMKVRIGVFIKNKVTKEFFEKPWLILTIGGTEYCPCGGYRTFENLVHVVNYIEQTFGTIKDYSFQRYKDAEFFGVLTQKKDTFYLVTIGSDYFGYGYREKRPRIELTPEERLLRQIFKIKPDPVKPNEEYDSHREFFIQTKAKSFEEFKDFKDLAFVITVASIQRKDDLILRYKPENTQLIARLERLAASDNIVNNTDNTIKDLKIAENKLTVSFYSLNIQPDKTVQMISNAEEEDDE